MQRIVEFSWNPLSIREASALQSALRSLAALFTTVTDALRSIYGCVTRRIHGAIENGLYCEPRLVSRHTNDVQIDAQEVVELYLARSVRVGIVETWKLDIGSDQRVGSVYGVGIACGRKEGGGVRASR